MILFLLHGPHFRTRIWTCTVSLVRVWNGPNLRKSWIKSNSCRYDLFRSVQNVSTIVFVCNLFTITSQWIRAMQHKQQIALCHIVMGLKAVIKMDSWPLDFDPPTILFRSTIQARSEAPEFFWPVKTFLGSNWRQVRWSYFKRRKEGCRRAMSYPSRWTVAQVD